MEVVALTVADRRLLVARYAEHENSHRRLRDALAEAGAADAVARLDALRRLERHFNLDLGLVCQCFARSADAATHPLERAIIGYVAELGRDEAGNELLYVHAKRARQLDDLMHGRLVGERD